MITMWVNPRIFLHDYPRGNQEKVPKKTKSEKRLMVALGVPFMLMLLLGKYISTLTLKTQGEARFWALWLNAAGVVWVFNVVDWLILDWLIFCTLTPRFLVIPESEGMAEYKLLALCGSRKKIPHPYPSPNGRGVRSKKDYGFHFRGFLHGTVYSILGGLIIAGIVFFL
jgi:hypothetical protein